MAESSARAVAKWCFVSGSRGSWAAACRRDCETTRRAAQGSVRSSTRRARAN
jgi:hypothetical protein